MSRRNKTDLPEQGDRWPPPAFQWYAADEPAGEAFKIAPLSERGLLLTALSYCWINDTMPSDHARLAPLLGVSVSEIERSWGELMRTHFVAVPGDETRLFDRELARQKQRMALRRAAQARGGSKGGKTTQARIRTEKAGASKPSSQPSTFAKASELNEKNRTEGFQSGAVMSADENRKWLRDYEGEPVGRAA